jgi:hypothetical protein
MTHPEQRTVYPLPYTLPLLDVTISSMITNGAAAWLLACRAKARAARTSVDVPRLIQNSTGSKGYGAHLTDPEIPRIRPVINVLPADSVPMARPPIVACNGANCIFSTIGNSLVPCTARTLKPQRKSTYTIKMRVCSISAELGQALVIWVDAAGALSCHSMPCLQAHEDVHMLQSFSG